MDVLSYIMVYAGSLLMAFNIFLYIRFSRKARSYANWSRESRVLYFPIVLLVLFLAGYLAVGIFGHPDIIIAAILFGGSIFVSVMLWLIERTCDKIKEGEVLEAKLLAAEEASQAKSFFLSNMSHDLRTPLNAVIGYTLLAKKEKASPDKQYEYICKIETAGNQLLDIINNILEMSRIESGKIEYNPQTINIEECVRESEDVFGALFCEKQISFSTECKVTHKSVVCDKTLLIRALTNLLSNAGKFTDAGGRIEMRLTELSYSGEKGTYEIRIKDSGIGMDPGFVELLFVPFERENTSTVSKIQGTGLGMAITKSIIEFMGGSISVKTAKGEGTEFIIVLPLSVMREEEINNSEESPGELRFDGKRVLIAEDNPVNREIAVLILTKSGFEAETAEDGREAVEKVSASAHGHYDLVLMDIQMPVMNGYEAARAIRALPDKELADIPIIALTANAFREDIEAAKNAGMDSHIAKPLNVEIMLSEIKRILDMKKG